MADSFFRYHYSNKKSSPNPTQHLYYRQPQLYVTSIHSFIPVACAECNDSLPFSGASSIPLCYVFFFLATLPHQLFFHPPSLHLVIYFLVYLSSLLFPNSYIIPFLEFYFLPLSVHVQTNVIYLTFRNRASYI